MKKHRREELELPWGRAKTADGREYLFNRLREPIWLRFPNSTRVLKCDGERGLWSKEQELFYGDDNPPWLDAATLERCRAVLAEWGVLP